MVAAFLYAVFHMNAKHFRWLFLIIAVGLLGREYYSKTMIVGATQSSADGQYKFAAGTELGAIAFALGIIAIFVLFLLSEPARLGEPMPGIFRRFAAVLLDFFLYMMVAAPLLGIAPVLMEWHRTGVFAWGFERDTAAPYDAGLLKVFWCWDSRAWLRISCRPSCSASPLPGPASWAIRL